MDTLYKIVSTVNTYLTDYVLIFLLVGTGIFFTVRTRFVQIRCFGEGMKSVFGKISLHGKNSGVRPILPPMLQNLHVPHLTLLNISNSRLKSNG